MNLVIGLIEKMSQVPNLTTNKSAQKWEALIVCIIFIFSVFSFMIIIKQTNSNWQSFDSSYIHYDFNAGKSLNHFAVRTDNGRYLIASETPNELRLALRFTKSALVRLSIDPEYPTWLCKSTSIGKAKLKLSSNTVDKTISLAQKSELLLKVFESQDLALTVSNSVQPGCGLALIKLETPTDNVFLIIAFSFYWFAVAILVLWHKQSIGLFGLTVALNLLCLRAMSTLGTISVSVLLFSCGISSIALGLSIGFSTLALMWLRGATIAGVVSAFVWFFSIFLVYTLQNNQPLSDDAVHAMLQTHPTEVWEYFSSQFNIGLLLLVFVSPVVLGFLLGKSNRSLSRVQSSLALGLVLLSVGVGLSSANRFELPVFQLIDRSLSSYNFELSQFKSLQKHRQNELQMDLLNAVNEAQTELSKTLVVVIGESANRDHMGVYGYVRDTTPWSKKLIDSGDMLKFDFAYSNHTHTNPSLSLALTRADQYKPERWMTAPSIINLANSRNIETSWITNQQHLGAWDSHASLIGIEAGTVVHKNKLTGLAKEAKNTDGVVLENVAIALEKSDATKLIFVHLQGSHADYCNRFPENHAAFKDAEATLQEFGQLARPSKKVIHVRLNCYDNSIRYTDFVLSELTKLMNTDTTPMAMLYFSDHSEDVIGNKFHDSALFTFDMTEIPLLFWANKSWKHRLPEQWISLKNNRQKDFTNDHIFETIAGLLGLKSATIDSRNDLSSPAYKEQQDPMTLHGRKQIKDVGNRAYWQRKNISKISSQAACQKLLPHRVNSIGKAKEAISAGVCGLEIDVLLTKTEYGVLFSVGHDHANLAGISLDEFLLNIGVDTLSKIWLDIKNLNDSNLDQALARLVQLDQRHNIKSKTLVETGFYAKSVAKFAKAGFRLSYYLPTSNVLANLGADEVKKQELGVTILQRIMKMEAQHISFDLRLYPFVKTTLEPLMEKKKLRYHSWFPNGFTFYTPNLLDELNALDYYSDPRVDTILLPFESPFYL